MHVTPLAWIITIVVLAAFLFVDILIIGRRPHVPSNKEAGSHIAFFIACALLFAAGVWFFSGPKYAGEFLAGWLTEYSLSVDNLFIFLLIMTKMKVPQKLQAYALMVGIVLALVLRGAFIAAGAALIHLFVWTFVLFGLILLYTAFKLVKDYFTHGDDESEGGDNWLVRQIRRAVPSTTEYHGTKSFARVDGKRLMTPMMLVIVALGSTDLMFALDSIPAIFGLTQEPYLVFAATVFALMGLRQLYFLLGTALQRLVYLSIGLSVILAFIGVKLILHALHEYHVITFEVSTIVSLGVIVVTLLITTVASLLKTRRSGVPVDPDAPLAADADQDGRITAREEADFRIAVVEETIVRERGQD